MQVGVESIQHGHSLLGLKLKCQLSLHFLSEPQNLLPLEGCWQSFFFFLVCRTKVLFAQLFFQEMARNYCHSQMLHLKLGYTLRSSYIPTSNYISRVGLKTILELALMSTFERNWMSVSELQMNTITPAEDGEHTRTHHKTILQGCINVSRLRF